ncbi:MFS-type transporter SLC18B1 [Trichonephila inaurata madagascariensis]|uniref:MFS-type transporter SLC18B1 n=1 Tax=Trichonephila inaurata madagascariensis TaxID=2747483 RepID=A0A8X6Y1T3_9ARAC|nr:MFS-type transporter SLC18B1 [Trichonephila inaurata madagascariensis]
MLLVVSKKLLLLLALWTGIFCNYACYSIIAPFFPQLARQKGLSAEQYSLVFGVYSLSQITFSIIVGRSLTKIGPKFIVLAGLFLTGGSTILFGCLEKSPGGPIFFWLCMAVRAVEGAGFAAYLTSSLAVIVKTFPTNPGYYVGLTETIVTVAMISGPPLGSALYTAGGYSCPFVSFGLGGEFLLQSGGCLIMAISFILIGPGSFLRLQPKIVLIVVGLLLKGLGAGPLISCSYSAALKAARRSGLPEDFRTYSLVSTLVSFSIPLGNLLGGVTTGIMTENLGMRVSTTVYGGIFLALAIICFIVHFYEPYLHKKTQELKWARMKQNLMQGEEMPLMNKIKTIYKTHDNGKIIPQNGGFGTMDNHCCVPLQEANLNEIVVGCETNPKLEWLDDPAQAKNFWLT